MAKDFIKTLWSWWDRLSLLFSHIKIEIGKGRIFGTKLHNSGQGNSILVDGKDLAFSDLLIRGNGNQLLNRGKIDRTRIVIEGNDNQLEIKSNANVTRSVIFLRGNHCRIIVGEGSDIGGMTAVCQGQGNEIIIGDNCLFSVGIDLWASDTHPIYDKNGEVCNHGKPIYIGNHVWLGKGVAVLKGCSIGNGSVVGMRSLVSHDLPSNVVAAGTPAKVIQDAISWDRKFVDWEK